jgi:hypothetical protein
MGTIMVPLLIEKKHEINQYCAESGSSNHARYGQEDCSKKNKKATQCAGNL